MAFHIHQSARSPRLTTERLSATLTYILAPDQWVCREASELPLRALVNAEPQDTCVSSLLRPWCVFRDSTARGLFLRQPSSQRPTCPTRGTPGIPLSGPVEVSGLEFLSAFPKLMTHSPPCSPCLLHIKNLFVDVLDFFWCALKIRKKLVQLRRGRLQSQCKSRATFPVSTSSKSRPETSSPRFNSTCHFLARGDTAHRKHPEASQEPEMVEFLPRLQLQRWTAKARDVRIDFSFFEKSRFAVFLHYSLFRGQVSSVRGPRSNPAKGRRVGEPNRCFGHMRPLKSEKTSKTDRTASSILGARTEMATMFATQKSMSVITRGQLLSAHTCGLEGDSRWRRHGDFILAGRIRHGHADVCSTMKERQQKQFLDVLLSSTLFFTRQTVPTGHASDRDAIWCLNFHRPLFSQPVCKNTRNCQQRSAHIVFSPASIRKRFSYMGASRSTPFWCNAFLPQ